MNFKRFILIYQIVYFNCTASIIPPHYGNSLKLPLNLAGLGGNDPQIGMPFSAPFPHFHPHSLLEQANNYPLTLSGKFPYETIGPHLMNHRISGSLPSPRAESLVLASMLSSEVGQNTLRQLLDSLSTARSSPAFGISSPSPLSHQPGSLGLFGQSTQQLPYLLSPSHSNGFSLEKPTQVHQHHIPPQSSEPKETSIYFDTPSPRINVVFRSSSTAVNVQQVHSQTGGSLRQTASEDSPQKLVHTVTKPVIHELNEIIKPVRMVNQEVLPLREEINTMIAKNPPEEIANKQESLPLAPSESKFSQADSQLTRESSSQPSLPIFSASSYPENFLKLEKEKYGERFEKDPPPSDGVVGLDEALSIETNHPPKRRQRNGGEAWVDEQEHEHFRPEDAVEQNINQQRRVN